MSPRALRLALLVVVAAALAAFATALRGSFVNWDDGWLILQNPYLRTLHHLPEILDPFADRTLTGAEYLPLRDLSNIADFALFGTEPTGYRLGNWLLHGLAAGAAYLLALEALRSPRAAFAAALLWAVHPLHAEVVAWASARKDLLNGVFALLAGALHLRATRTGSARTAWAATGLFLLATLSKSSAAGLPFLLAGWEAATGDRSVPFATRAWAAVRRAAPMMVVAAAGAAINARHQAAAGVVAEWRGGGPAGNVLVVAGIHLRYIGQVLWPAGLSVDYAVPEGGGPGAAVGILLAAGLLVAGAWLALRRARAGLAILWWFAMLAPVSNLLIPISNASADRYLFLPLLGPCLLAGMAFDALRERGRLAARAAAGALAAVVLVLGIAAAAQARVWRDGVTLWARAVEVSPGVGRAWMNYGEALAFARRDAEALAAYRRMVEVEPRNSLYWVCAGNRLYEIGGPAHYDEVQGFLETAVREAPPNKGGQHVALAWFLNERGHPAEAVALLLEAVRRQPDLGPAHFNLGLWHLHERRWERAAEEIEDALRFGGLSLSDRALAHDRLHEAYEKTGDFDRSRRHREERERILAITRGE